MKFGSTKKSRRDRLMRSNSFETQGVKEISWKKACESRGFLFLWMGTIDEDF